MHTEPTDPFAPVPRIVKPRRRHAQRLPIIAVVGDEALTEAGELLTKTELIARLPDLPPTLFVTDGSPGDLVAEFTDVFSVSHPTSWQYRLSDPEPKARPTEPGRIQTQLLATAVSYFGFKKHNSIYHKIIDPVNMHSKGLGELIPGGAPRIAKALQWATWIRDFCAVSNLKVKPTGGGIASQFLTDPRFYPNARRKVPSCINGRARDNLPGNHYQLHAPLFESVNAVYEFDQHRAHHFHARQIHFPHADELYAYGHFHSLAAYCDPSNLCSGFMGLLCLDLQAPPWWKRYYSWLGDDLTCQFIHTNELPDLLDIGYRVLHIRAAWGSFQRDTGLNKFAHWAWEQLDAYHDPPWLKMLLLATYGTLATRPSDMAAIFRLTDNGEIVTRLTGRYALTGKRVKRPFKLEPGISNVIHRGMIEAATRAESVSFARHLARHGQRVLHIYADAVLIEANDDRPPPLLLDPWRLKMTHTHWVPLGKHGYRSDQATRNPGGHPLEHRRMTAITKPSKVMRAATR